MQHGRRALQLAPAWSLPICRPNCLDAKPAQTKGRNRCFLQVDGQYRCATSLGKGSRTRPCVRSAVERNHRKQIVDPQALSGEKTRGNRRYQQSRPITRKPSPEKRPYRNAAFAEFPGCGVFIEDIWVAPRSSVVSRRDRV